MSKKTNSLSFRLLNQKNWCSKSFFEDYNYSKLLYQDLYIQNYVKNYCESRLGGSFIHNISIQRIESNIHIFLDYYRANHFASFSNKIHKKCLQFQYFGKKFRKFLPLRQQNKHGMVN